MLERSLLCSKFSLHGFKVFASTSNKFCSKCKQPRKNYGFWENQINIDRFLDDLKRKFNLNNQKDWNLLTRTKILSQGGSGLLSNFSMYEIKCMAFPEGKNLFKKPIKPGYWDNEVNIQKFMISLQKKYNLNIPEDWNKSITYDVILENGGRSLLKKYSVKEIKCIGCPEGKDLFEKNSEYWNNKENVNNFIEEFKDKFKITKLEDWKSISKKDIELYGGKSLLRKYSLKEIKNFANLNDDKFINFNSKGYWDKNENVYNFLQELKDEYNLDTFDDWNNLTYSQVKLLGGESLLKKYLLYELKCMAYPEGKPYFDTPSKSPNYWLKPENIKVFMADLGNKLLFKSPEDWDTLNKNHIISFGGSSLLKTFSMYELKCIGCPEGKELFNYPTKPKGYWDNCENVQNFIDDIKSTFNLKNPSDWNRVSKAQIQSLGGGGFISKYLTNQENRKKIELKVPEIAYIKYQANSTPYSTRRSSQRWLFLQVQKIFPGEEIVEDYFHSDLSRKTGYSFQFDVFVIGRNIAFEYHGEQHYEELVSGFAPLEMYKNRDQEKEKICSDHGIQLIIIPYWWNNKLESLKQTIEEKLDKIK